MTESRVERHLAAILAADVVGFSRLMEANEAGTLASLKSRRQELLSPLIAKYQGRLVKMIGDGALVEFVSAVNAVQCAIEIQKAYTAANEVPVANQPPIVLRIGITLGDVVVEGNDIYGDGVNIAARLEGLAEPGGICISAKVHAELNGKIDDRFEYAGEQQLKNISAAVGVFRYRRDGRRSPPHVPIRILLCRTSRPLRFSRFRT
jgi:adenylate cyclase